MSNNIVWKYDKEALLKLYYNILKEYKIYISYKKFT